MLVSPCFYWVIRSPEIDRFQCYERHSMALRYIITSNAGSNLLKCSNISLLFAEFLSWSSLMAAKWSCSQRLWTADAWRRKVSNLFSGVNVYFLPEIKVNTSGRFFDWHPPSLMRANPVPNPRLLVKHDNRTRNFLLSHMGTAILSQLCTFKALLLSRFARDNRGILTFAALVRFFWWFFSLIFLLRKLKAEFEVLEERTTAVWTCG